MVSVEEKIALGSAAAAFDEYRVSHAKQEVSRPVSRALPDKT
jgi:hypothetical protein